MNGLKKAVAALGLVGLLSSPYLLGKAGAEENVAQIQNHIEEAQKYFQTAEDNYQSCFKEKKCDFVIEQYKKAIQLNPNFAQAYHHLGAAYIETKQFDEAIPYLKKAVELEPKDAMIHRNLSLAYIELGEKRMDKNLIYLGLAEAEKIFELESPNSDLYKQATNIIKNTKRVDKEILKE
jgi:tetratricopeptide (TPR) repeat protein